MDMTLVTPNPTDGVWVHCSSVEWGLIGGRLLSAMSECQSEEDASEEAGRRRKLKNEDSSYDSDFDPCDATSSTHEDVSRTASETLVAEFEDYITKPLSTSTSTSVLTESADYPQQVEFGVKLGYSESLVQLALTKLGPNPDKNELLDELIRLGAGAPKADCEDEQPESEEPEKSALRHIIIDGSNVAITHGNKNTGTFSCKGLRLCVDWFRARGHKEITVLVPSYRREPSRLDSPITDQEILQELEEERVLFFTPSRMCGGKRIVPYDDRYILKEALKSDGVIVSNDHYRDLKKESQDFKNIIESSLLMYSWVNGRFEPPDDPLGRNGPSLDAFLKKKGGVTAKASHPCPYGKKCTYGNKCKYMHPERGAAPIKSVTEILQEQKQKHYQEKAKSRDSSPGEVLRAKSLTLPATSSESLVGGKIPLSRTQSNFPSFSQTTKEPTISELSADLDSLCGQQNNSLFSLWSDNNLVGASAPSQQPPIGKPLFEPEVPENLHQKLNRQLSINPTGDDRLLKMCKHHQQYQNQPCPSNAPPMLPFQQMMQQPPRPPFNLMPYIHPPITRHSSSQEYSHPPITRHSSSQEAKPSYSQHMLPLCFHSPVGRNLSAPDHLRSAVSSSGLPRGTSISDSRLNLYASDSFLHPPIGLSSSSPGPIGSRPMSPQQIQRQHLPQSASLTPTSANTNEDERLKIFYHLSQLFPEAQVRAALARNPDETDPFKICGSILGFQSGRPTSPGVSSYVPPDTARETARIQAYAALTKLFPEDQVRNLLIRYPEETDSTKLCMLLMSLREGSQ